jgi:dephospho-CoA kinase
LLVRWGLERHCDAVLAVVAPEALQLERLVRSRGWTEAEARARLAAQSGNSEFAAAADVTLDNRDDRASLERAAREAVARLRAGQPPRSGAGRKDTC